MEVLIELKVYCVSYHCEKCSVEVIYLPALDNSGLTNQCVHSCPGCNKLYYLDKVHPYLKYVPIKKGS